MVKAACECIDIDTGLDDFFDVGDRIGHGEGRFLHRSRTGLGDVIAGDVNRIVTVHVFRPVGNAVTHDAHGRPHRKNPLLLGARKLVQVVTATLRKRDVHGEQDPCTRVDGHGYGDLGEIDAVEQRLHVVEHVDSDPLASDLAHAHSVIRVVTHQGRHVEIDREPGLPLGYQVLETLVGIGSGPEAGDLPHGP
jgi:hypothetical protein